MANRSTQNDRDAQLFTTQVGGQYRKTVGKFAAAFEAAGYDLGPLFTHFMLHSAIGTKFSAQMRQGVKDVLQEASSESEKTLDAVLGAIQSLHTAKTTNDRERLRIMSVVAPIFTRNDLLRRGFRVSNDAFANARKHKANFGAGAAVPAGGRPRLYDGQLHVLIQQFLLQPQNSAQNPAYIDAALQLIGGTVTCNAEGVLELHDPMGNLVPLPLEGDLVDDQGQIIHTHFLRRHVATLFTDFQKLHPKIRLTYQAMRSLIPPNFYKKPHSEPSDIDDDPAAPVIKRKRSRSSMAQRTTSDLDASQALEHHLEPSPADLPDFEEGMDDNQNMDMELVHQLHAVPAEEDVVNDAEEAEEEEEPPRKRMKLEETH